MRSRGRLLWRQEWYSVCSIHRPHRDDCNMCRAGSWVNVWKQRASHLFYVISPSLWRKWANK